MKEVRVEGGKNGLRNKRYAKIDFFYKIYEQLTLTAAHFDP